MLVIFYDFNTLKNVCICIFYDAVIAFFLKKIHKQEFTEGLSPEISGIKIIRESIFQACLWNKNEKQKLGRAVKLSYDPHEKKSIIYNRKTAYSG